MRDNGKNIFGAGDGFKILFLGMLVFIWLLDIYVEMWRC